MGRPREVRAHHVKLAMTEIDDVHDAKDKRQSKRRQSDGGSDDQAIGQLNGDLIHVLDAKVLRGGFFIECLHTRLDATGVHEIHTIG